MAKGAEYLWACLFATSIPSLVKYWIVFYFLSFECLLYIQDPSPLMNMPLANLLYRFIVLSLQPLIGFIIQQ